MPRRSEDAEPTLGDIEAWCKEAESYWSPQKSKDRDDFELYHNEHEVEAPLPAGVTIIAEPEELRQGRGGEIVDHATGILDVDPQISIDAVGRRAEDAEKWANLVRPTAEREQGEDTNSRATNEAALYGYTGVKVLPHPALWSGQYPKKGYDRDNKPLNESDRQYNRRVGDFEKNAPLPLSFWHVPARTWHPHLSGRNVTKSIEIKDVTAGWVESRYGRYLDRSDVEEMRKLREVRLIEYVDNRWCGYYVRGKDDWKFKKQLRIWPHMMPLPEDQAPVVLIEGLTTGDSRPGYRWKGVLRDLREAIIGQDLTVSRELTSVVLFFWLTVIHKITEKGGTFDDFDKLQKQRQFTLGGTNFVLPNEELEIMGLQGQLPDSEGLFNKLESRIARAWPLLQDLSSASSSGYDFNIRRDWGLKSSQPLADHLAQGDADIIRMAFYALDGIAKLLKQDNMRVYVREPREDGVKAIGVGWNDVRDLIPLVRAKRDPDMVTDLHSKIDAAIKAWEKMKLPWRWCVQEIMGEENPEELKDEYDIEQMVDAPEIIQQERQEMAMEMELELAEREGMTMEQVAEAVRGGQVPSPGVAGALSLVPQGNGAGGMPPMTRTNPRGGTMTQPPAQQQPPGPPTVGGGV